MTNRTIAILVAFVVVVLCGAACIRGAVSVANEIEAKVVSVDQMLEQLK